MIRFGTLDRQGFQRIDLVEDPNVMIWLEPSHPGIRTKHYGWDITPNWAILYVERGYPALPASC